MNKKFTFVFFMLLALCCCPNSLTAQEKNLQKSFDESCGAPVGSAPKIDAAHGNSDALEMLRAAWTIRGADNQLYQLEYFFPQIVSPVPFSINTTSTKKAPKDFATSVVIPEEQGVSAGSGKNGFDQMPSVDNLVTNSGQGKKQGNQQQTQSQTNKQNQQQNQQQKQNKQQTQQQKQKQQQTQNNKSGGK